MILGFLIATVFVLSSRQPAWSATITVEDRQHCEIKLAGAIGKGDIDRLRTTVDSIVAQGDVFGRPMRLCLDSPGGSLGEGARIAKLVREWGLATRILAGDSCLSACSWIFMLGTTDQMWGENRGEYDYVDRAMATTAKLGFHAPELVLGTAPMIETDTAQKGYRILISAFAEILSLSYDPWAQRQALIPDDLLERAMRTPPDPDKIFYIDTVDKAGRWNIKVTGFAVPERLDAEMAANVCLNTTAWHVSTAESRYGDHADAYSVEYDATAGSYKVSGPLAGMLGHGCTIETTVSAPSQGEVVSAAGHSAAGCFQDDYSELDFCGGVDVLAAFAPETPLRELPTRPFWAVAAAQPANCWFRDGTATVANVNEYVNLRANSTMASNALERIPLGATVQLADRDTIYHPVQSADAKRCFITCAAFYNGTGGTNDRPDLSRCLTDNMLWAKVLSPRGTEGFLSLKFLE